MLTIFARSVVRNITTFAVDRRKPLLAPFRLPAFPTAAAIRKATALVTLASFLVSCVLGDLVHAVAATTPGDRPADASAVTQSDVPAIPSSIGRITDSYAGSLPGARAPRVVLIQDLHCNPEVQGNIARILKHLNAQHPLRRVYVEGAAGDVDTSWLCALGDARVKREIADLLVRQGRLTGSEYFSVLENAPHLLRGVEDEARYRENYRRLTTILENRQTYEEFFRQRRAELQELVDSSCGRENRRLYALVQNYRAGKLDENRYYAGLDGLRRKMDALAPGAHQYPAIDLFRSMARSREALKPVKVTAEMRRLIAELKGALPYKDYWDLVERTNNFRDTAAIGEVLPAVVRAHIPQPEQRYPNVALLFSCLSQSAALNTLALIREEDALRRDLQEFFARTPCERDAVFLARNFDLMEDCFMNKLTAGGYAELAGTGDTFVSLWGRYAKTGFFDGVAVDYRLLQDYYAANNARNEIFLKDMGLEKEANGELSVVVTGGYHTEGMQKLLRERKISYVTIMPAVTTDARVSDATYRVQAQLQARYLFQAFALYLVSAFGPEARREQLSEAVAIDTFDRYFAAEKDRPFGELALAKVKELLGGKDRDEMAAALQEFKEHWNSDLGGTFGPVRDALCEEQTDGSVSVTIIFDGQKTPVRFTCGRRTGGETWTALSSAAPTPSSVKRTYFRNILITWGILVVIPMFLLTVNSLYNFPWLLLTPLTINQVISLWLGLRIAREVHAPDSTTFSTTIKPVATPGQWPSQTTCVPVYKEPWPMIRETLEYAIAARDRYNGVAGRPLANIVVSDDGLMELADNRVEEIVAGARQKLARGEALTVQEEEVFQRVAFYQEHGVAVVARPRNKTQFEWGTFERRGVFKKGSNLNHTLRLADLVAGALPGRDMRQAVETAKQTLVAGKPIFAHTFVLGELSIGDILLQLDKDSHTPVNGIVNTVPEFVHDTSLGYTQNYTVVTNQQESFIARIMTGCVYTMWHYGLETLSQEGFSYFFGHNGFIRKEVLKQCGYWSEEDVAEDVSLTLQIATKTDPVTGSRYHGKYIHYDHTGFKEIAALTQEALNAHCAKHAITGETAAAFAAQSDDRIVLFAENMGLVGSEIRALLGSQPREMVARALLVYGELSSDFGEAVPERPLSVVLQVNKFGYGSTQVWLNPVSRWFKEGVLRPNFKKLLFNPRLHWTERLDVLIGLSKFIIPISVLFSTFQTVVLALAGVSFPMPLIMTITAASIILTNLPDAIIAVKNGTVRKYAAELLPNLFIQSSLVVNSVVGGMCYLLGIPKAFGSTPMGQTKRSYKEVISEIVGKLKPQLVMQASYFVALGALLFRSARGGGYVDPSSFPLLTVGTLMFGAALLVPFIFEPALRRDKSTAGKGAPVVTPLKELSDPVVYKGMVSAS